MQHGGTPVVLRYEASGVDGQARAQLAARWPRVASEERPRCCRAFNRSASAFEDGDDRVGYGLDRCAAVRCDGLANERAVFGCDLGRGIVSELTNHLRESVQVSGQQCPDSAVGVAGRLVLMGFRRFELPLEPLYAELEEALRPNDVLQPELAQVAKLEEIGRASCRERVEESGVDVSS